MLQKNASFAIGRQPNHLRDQGACHSSCCFVTHLLPQGRAGKGNDPLSGVHDASMQASMSRISSTWQRTRAAHRHGCRCESSAVPPPLAACPPSSTCMPQVLCCTCLHVMLLFH